MPLGGCSFPCRVGVWARVLGFFVAALLRMTGERALLRNDRRRGRWQKERVMATGGGRFLHF